MKKMLALIMTVLLVLALPSVAEAKTVYSNVISLPKIEKETNKENENAAEPEKPEDVTTETPAATVSAIYAAPDAASELLSYSGNGEEIEYLSFENGWAKVRVNDMEGYLPENEVPEDVKNRLTAEQTEVENELADEEFYKGTVIAGNEDGLTVYKEKSTESEIIGFIPVGSQLAVGSIEDDWAMVTDGKISGYVYTGKIALVDTEPVENKKIRTIQIVNDLNGETQIESGTVVTFTAVLKGFENDTYTVRWFEAAPGGEYLPMKGENGLSISLPITESNCRNSWRVVVTLTNVD